MFSNRAPVGAVGAALAAARNCHDTAWAGGDKPRPYGTEVMMKVVGKQ
jgi:hypothetical protein